MKSNGSALLTVVIVIGFTFLLAAAVLTRSIINIRSNSSGTDKVQAFYYAEMGIMNKINFLIVSLNSGSYKTNSQDNYDIILPQNNSFSTNAPYAADFQGDIVLSGSYVNSMGNNIRQYKTSLHSNAKYKGIICNLTETVIVSTKFNANANSYQYDSYKVVNKVVNYR